MFDGYTTRTLCDATRLLNHALRLLAAPERWTREVWARNRAGDEVEPASRSAVCWCAGGAILAANNDLFPARDALRIPVDQETGEATLVRGPKRVVVALEALGVGFMKTSPERIRASPLSAVPGRRHVPLVEQHPTLLASDINDLLLIKHPHVALALAWTMVALHDEIERRGARRSARAPGDPEGSP